MSKILTRLSVITFWLLLIAIALYVPKWGTHLFEQNSINVFAWGDILDPSVIAEFEKESGIKVHLNYYSSNEELLVKMKATRGKGYDLIIPSDYVIPLLRNEGLLKQLDKDRISAFSKINPLLCNLPYDPENRFSLPFEWEIFGLGVDKKFFQTKPLEPSWKAVFDQEVVHYKITMINDPIQSILLSAFYLFGPVDRLNTEQTEAVKHLLFQQKRWVEAYADFRGDYFLATNNCPVVVASSAYIWRAKRKFDFIDFIIPQEGSFISIENFAIPAASKKERLVYQLISYLYKISSLETHYSAYGFFPAVLHPDFLSTLEPQERDLITSSAEHFKKYHFTKVLLPYHEIPKLWVELKTQ